MKKWIAGLIAIVLSAIVMLSGCAGNQRGDELIVWWVSGRENEQIINDAVADFKAEHPGQEISIVSKPSMDVYNAYKFALNDDNTRPDIAILDHVYVQSLAHDGLVANVNELGMNEIKDLYPEGLYSAVTYNGSAYALPLSANTIILMCNKDMLAEAGVIDDAGNAKLPETLDELYDACEKVKAKYGENRAFAQPLNSFAVMQFMSYVGRLGGKIVSDDYKTILLEDNAEVKTALEDWKKFTDLGYANPNEFEEGKFYNGQIAFVEMGSWNLSKVRDVEAFDCGFTEMVTIDPAQPNYSGLGLYSLVIAEKSAKKQEAFELAKYLSTDKDVQLAFNKAQNIFPVTKEALSDPYYTEDEILAKYASQLEKVTPRPGTPVWPDLEQSLVTMLRSAILNDNVDAAISAAQEAAQSATNRLLG